MTPRISPMVAVIAFACLSIGCTSSKVLTVGNYQRGGPGLLTRAPETAVYKVQWLSADHREIKSLPDSGRLVLRGEPLGFSTAPDGRVTVVAGINKFTLDTLPSRARYFQWRCRAVKETRLGRNVRDANDAVGEAPALGVGLGVEAAGTWKDPDADSSDKPDRRH